jgi:hypothetical protein
MDAACLRMAPDVDRVGERYVRRTGSHRPQPTTLCAIENSSKPYVHRSSAWLVGGFATVAYLLGTVGLYGVVA